VDGRPAYPIRDLRILGQRPSRVTIEHVFRIVSRTAAAASVVLLLSLTACGGEDEPTATESDVPAFADNEGPAGAEQFVGFWTDTLNRATTSGDTEELRSLSADACQACGDFATQLDQIYAAGGRVESDGWEITKVVPEAGATDNEVGLLVTYTVSPQKVYQSEDAKAKKFKGGNQGFRFHLIRDQGEWQVHDLSPR
jgi:hypothetical protein